MNNRDVKDDKTGSENMGREEVQRKQDITVRQSLRSSARTENDRRTRKEWQI